MPLPLSSQERKPTSRILASYLATCTCSAALRFSFTLRNHLLPIVDILPPNQQAPHSSLDQYRTSGLLLALLLLIISPVHPKNSAISATLRPFLLCIRLYRLLFSLLLDRLSASTLLCFSRPIPFHPQRLFRRKGLLNLTLERPSTILASLAFHSDSACSPRPPYPVVSASTIPSSDPISELPLHLFDSRVHIPPDIPSLFMRPNRPSQTNRLNRLVSTSHL